MAIKREESEFAKFPAEQVVDWLGHPVTAHLRDVVTAALLECDQKAVQLCGHAGAYDDGVLKANAMIISAAKGAYAQLGEFITEAEEYVKG